MSGLIILLLAVCCLRDFADSMTPPVVCFENPSSETYSSQFISGDSVWIHWSVTVPSFSAPEGLSLSVYSESSGNVFFIASNLSIQPGAYLWTISSSFPLGRYHFIMEASGSSSISVSFSIVSQIFYSLNVAATMFNPDGFWTRVYTVSGHFPGPTLWVNDRNSLTINVTNSLEFEELSIHWHGVLQHNTPFTDGVHGVTQMGIMPKQTYSYAFNTVDEIGSHWYHSHSGIQYADGLYGSLIIRDPQDPYEPTISGDFVLQFSEWFHRTSFEQESDLHFGTYEKNFNLPPWNSGLVNGRGLFNCSLTGYMNWTHFVGIGGPSMYSCSAGNITTVNVAQNATYRFRIVNTSPGLSLKISIDNHTMVIVAIDGSRVAPFPVQVIEVAVAQRYDVLVTANQAMGSYYIRAKNFQTTSPFYAILQYYGSSDTLPISKPQFDNPDAIFLNSANFAYWLSPDSATAPVYNPNYNKSVNVTIACDPDSGRTCTMNGVAFSMPVQNPIIIDFMRGVTIPPSSVYHEILEMNDAVFLIVRNTDVEHSHPFHLHGHDMWVVGVGAPNAGDYGGQLLISNPVQRDTVLVRVISNYDEYVISLLGGS
jgi:iron transport multicopper oxidase